MKKPEIASVYPSALFKFAIALKEARSLTWKEVAEDLHIPNCRSFATLVRQYRRGSCKTELGDRLYEDYFVISQMIKKGKTLQEMSTETGRDLPGLHRRLTKWGLDKSARYAIARGERQMPPVSVIWSGRKD